MAVRARKKTAKKHPAVRVGTVNQVHEACAAAGQVGRLWSLVRREIQEKKATRSRYGDFLMPTGR